MRYENATPFTQKVWDEEGNSYELAAGAVEFLKPKIADLFLKQCPGEVIRFEDANVPVDAGSSEVWVANNTGNPEFPKTYELEVYDRLNKKWVKTEELHPLREPHTIKHEWDPGQADIVREGQLIKHANLSSITIKLPPFYRRKLPRPVFYAWQSCLQLGPNERSMALIESRQPTVYEPNESWELDKIIAYGNAIDPKFRERYGLKVAAECEGEVEKDREQRRALDVIYFYLINPAIKLPPEKAVDKEMTSLKVVTLRVGKLKS